MQFAIMASTLIAILLLSFLMLTYVHSFFKTQQGFFLQTIAVANQNILKEGIIYTSEIPVHDDKVNSTVHKSYWGAFENITSISERNGFTFSKKALLGTKVEQPFTGIILSDTRLPLVLTGSSIVVGMVYVSDKGIKPGNISGNYFTGTLPAISDIKTTSGRLPQFDPLWKNYQRTLLDYIPTQYDLTVASNTEVTNSFFEDTRYVYLNEKWIVAESYTGHLILKSETEIVVTKHAKLRDVIVVAPKITIESGFKGNAYFLASEELIVEENVYLEYPSSLIFYKNRELEETKTSIKESNIQIGENTILKGVVIFLTEDVHEYHTNTNIFIAPSSTLVGEVYCEGNIELYGSVKGTIYAHRFITNKFGSIYVNHIFNGAISGKSLPDRYCGLPFENGSKKLVKWLY
ncbi:hypothetical protein [uncultured Planktosalinus sp.]|uniref:hypothetical protein n=1 Tax=uncultured Planktosalinus sp. TaxID=1810935 RepID=UPI0030D6D419